MLDSASLPKQSRLQIEKGIPLVSEIAIVKEDKLESETSETLLKA